METDAGLSAVEKIPAEVWLEVSRSTDLHSLSVASRRFRDLTTHALHRDLVWVNTLHIARNLAVWQKNKGMESSVRSLKVNLSGLEPNTNKYTTVVEESIRNGTCTPARLRGALHERIRSFTNLSSLVFTRMAIRSDHFALIHALPQLRSLGFDACIFKYGAASNFNNKNLPIAELTLRNVRPRPRVQLHNPHTGIHQLPVAQVPIGGVHPGIAVALQQQLPLQPPDSLAQALSLAIAHNLKTLRVDATADVFRLVYDALDSQARGWTVPASIENVYIFRKYTVAAWEPNQPPSSGGGHSPSVFPDTHLYYVCAHAPNLKTVSTPLFAPGQMIIAPEVLPLGLTRFAAPTETAQFIAALRDVKALGLFEYGLKGREDLTALADIGRTRPHLKMLLMEVKAWDPEIVAAVTLHFKELRRLKIVYDGRGPDEKYVVSLAPDFLAQLPDLHTLELYRLPKNGGFMPVHPKHLFDSSWGSIEEEMRDILIGWNRFCTKLRRVQLVSGYVMTRGYEGGRWAVEKVHRLEQIEDLEY